MTHDWPHFKRLGPPCGLALALLIGLLVGLSQPRSVLAEVPADGAPSSSPAFPLGITYIVTNTDGAGTGSLRRAILDANASPGADTITFNLAGCSPANPCVISPTNPLPLITDTLTISGTDAASLIIDANHTMRGLRMDAVPVKVTDLTIQNGQTPDDGAGIRSDGSLVLARVRLMNNQAGTDGGGVYAANGVLIDDGYFENNSAAIRGGGLYSGAGVGLSNTDFISNTAPDGGGASGGITWVIGGRFERNFSGEYGGGLLATSVALTGTQFISNTALEAGGGVYTGGDAAFNQGQFERNSADQGGGGSVDGRLILADTAFYSNTASFGGGLYLGGESRLDHGRFEHNQTTLDGAGIYALGDIQLSATPFISNDAASGVGGGLGAFYGARVTIDNGWFERNHAVYGGGINAFDPVTITHAIFISNTAEADGGAAGLYDAFTIAASLFIANQADHGGGLVNDTGSGFVLNSLFVRNVANVGTALDIHANGGVALTYSTIVGIASTPAQGIAVENGTLFMSDSILSQHAIGVQNLGGSVTYDYNLFFANTTDSLGTFSGAPTT